jgi:hypothetical protein
LTEIRNRDKPVYAPLCKVREEMDGFRTYFKMKKDLHEGVWERKTLSTWEDIDALFTKKRKMR